MPRSQARWSDIDVLFRVDLSRAVELESGGVLLSQWQCRWACSAGAGQLVVKELHHAADLVG